jgi:hypothetical protein
MSITANLMAGAYPAVGIERWTANDGWPCLRVFVAIMGKRPYRIQLGEDFATIMEAKAVAEEYAASHLPAVIPVIDMSKDRHGG